MNEFDKDVTLAPPEIGYTSRALEPVVLAAEFRPGMYGAVGDQLDRWSLALANYVMYAAVSETEAALYAEAAEKKHWPQIKTAARVIDAAYKTAQDWYAAKVKRDGDANPDPVS